MTALHGSIQSGICNALSCAVLKPSGKHVNGMETSSEAGKLRRSYWGVCKQQVCVVWHMHPFQQGSRQQHVCRGDINDFACSCCHAPLELMQIQITVLACALQDNSMQGERLACSCLAAA